MGEERLELLLDEAATNRQRSAMTESKPSLNDTNNAQLAWARYRTTLKWMMIPSAAAAVGALLWMHYYGGGLTIAVALATTFGVGLTVMMAAALMGLVFLSSGSGHDEDVDAQSKETAVRPDETD